MITTQGLRASVGNIVVGGVPITLQSVTSVAAAGNTVVINTPATIAPGDLLLAYVYLTANANRTIESKSTDWTELVDRGSVPNAALYSRVVTGSEATSYTFALTGGTVTTTKVVAILHFRNANLGAVGTFGSASLTTSIIAPGITIPSGTVANPSMLLGFVNGIGANISVTKSGWTQIFSDANAATPSGAVLSISAVAGDTGAQTFTSSVAFTSPGGTALLVSLTPK